MKYRPDRGYTLIELLVVLAIVGILAMVGVSMIGNRPSGSVLTVMNELEGTLMSAQKWAVSSGRDALVVTQGDWGSVGTTTLLAYGDAALGQVTVRDNGLTASESFRVASTVGGGLRREHMYAGVVAESNAGWWGTASAPSVAITSVEPFKTTAGFTGLLAQPANNLFQGGANLGVVRISGANKRFATSFWIQVVPLQNGQPLAGGPLGVMVVLANGAQIYKFYNPGTLNGGNGQWRKV